jgi:hypothetical protein
MSIRPAAEAFTNNLLKKGTVPIALARKTAARAVAAGLRAAQQLQPGKWPGNIKEN